MLDTRDQDADARHADGHAQQRSGYHSGRGGGGGGGGGEGLHPGVGGGGGGGGGANYYADAERNYSKRGSDHSRT